MKKLILVVLIAAGTWWYFVGGRKLSEEQVQGFYRNLERATLERKPEALCSLLAKDFESTGTVAIAGQSRTQAQDKAQTCEGYRQLYEGWESWAKRWAASFNWTLTTRFIASKFRPTTRTLPSTSVTRWTSPVR